MSGKVGFIGVGTMGKPIAGHLLGSGRQLVIFDIDVVGSAGLVEAGAGWCDSPRQVADAADVVFLSLPGPVEVDTVVRGEDGLLASDSDNLTIIDLSTNSVAMVRDLAGVAAECGAVFLDAPVSGGAVGAENGALTVMIGGDEPSVDAVRPLLGCFAKDVAYLGPSGAGTLAKLVNNQIFLCASVLIQEGFVMAAKAGMDIDQLLHIVGKSSAGMYMRLAPLLFGRRFNDVIFKLAIAEKDVAVALASARELDVPMPTTEAAHGVYRDALELGLGEEVFYATLKALEAKAGATVAQPGEGTSTDQETKEKKAEEEGGDKGDGK